MTIFRAVLLTGAALMLGGCGQGDDADPAEAGKGGWRILPGTYGNVADNADGPVGVELRLDKGSESETVAVVLCNGDCAPAQTRPLRRGLNGISFTLPQGGHTADVMIQPAGKDGVTFNVDWGSGLKVEHLSRIEDTAGRAAQAPE